MPGHPDYLNRHTPSSMYHVVSAASNNAAVVKNSPGVVTGYYIVNTAAAFRYVKLYNQTSSPSPGSDTPAWVIGVPPTSAANINYTDPLHFGTGIGIAIVTGIADNNNTAVAANDVSVSLAYQ